MDAQIIFPRKNFAFFLQRGCRHSAEDECVPNEQRRLHDTESASVQTRTAVRGKRVRMFAIRLNCDAGCVRADVVPRTHPCRVRCESGRVFSRIIKVVIDCRLCVCVSRIVNGVCVRTVRRRAPRMSMCGQVFDRKGNSFAPDRFAVSTPAPDVAELEGHRCLL